MYEPLRHIRKDVWDDDYSPEHPYAELPGKHYVGSSERYRQELSSVRNTSTSWYYDVSVGPTVDIWNRHIKVRRIRLYSLSEDKCLKYRNLQHITDLHLTTRQWLKKRCPHIDFGPEPDIEQAATERYRARGAQGSSRKVEGDGICAKVSGDNITEAVGKGSVEAPAGGQIMPEKTTYMTRECTVADTPAPCAARDGREGGIGEAECPAPVQEQQPMERPIERRSSIAVRKRPAVPAQAPCEAAAAVESKVTDCPIGLISPIGPISLISPIYCQLTRAP